MPSKFLFSCKISYRSGLTIKILGMFWNNKSWKTNHLFTKITIEDAKEDKEAPDHHNHNNLLMRIKFISVKIKDMRYQK